jgi:hypothetical protein
MMNQRFVMRRFLAFCVNSGGSPNDQRIGLIAESRRGTLGLTIRLHGMAMDRRLLAPQLGGRRKCCLLFVRSVAAPMSASPGTVLGNVPSYCSGCARFVV